MRQFQSALLDCGLHEVEFMGSPFTWSNGHTWERLDRGLLNHEGTLLWPNLVNIGASDHLPLLFYLEGGRFRGDSRKLRRFLFELSWVHENTCEEVVNEEWGSSAGVDSVMERFQRLGRCLQKWNRDNLGNIPKKIKGLQEELQLLAFDDPNVLVQERRRCVRNELTKYTKYEEEL